MAWTAPTTQTTGTLITASVWNTDLTDNLAELKDPPSDNYELNEGSNYTTSSTTFVDIDGTNLALTLTTNGGDVMVSFHGSILVTGAYLAYLDVDVDGARDAGDDGMLLYELFNARAKPMVFTRLITGLAAGSHTFTLQWKVSSGAAVATLYAGAGTANYDVHPQFWAREVS